MNKKELAQLYKKHSIAEIAEILKKSRSSIYRLLIQHGIDLRTKQEAQKKIKKHQRLGKSHSLESIEKISLACEEHWDKNTRKFNGGNKSKLTAMNNAAKPKNGELSRLGKRLHDFIAEKEPVKAGIRLTRSRASDIILVEKGLVIELTMPFEVFDLSARYQAIIDELNGLGYKVLVVQQASNSISLARCRKIYKAALSLAESANKSNIIRL